MNFNDFLIKFYVIKVVIEVIKVYRKVIESYKVKVDVKIVKKM